jgi:hypothetical protein
LKSIPAVALCRDAKTPEEYRLVDGYADDMRELVSGYQAKVANQGAARQRHGGRMGKRGGKVRNCHWGGRHVPFCSRENPTALCSGHSMLHDKA